MPEQFQSALRLSHNHAESHGNGQSNHSRAGNPYTHGVLYDVGTQATLNSLDLRWGNCGKFASTGGSESHGYRLGAARSRYNFSLQQLQNAVFQ